MNLRFWRTSLSCQQFTEMVTAYLDRSLPTRVLAAIDGHLMKCEHCTEYFAQFRRTVGLVGALPAEEPPSELLDAMTEAFLRLHGETER